MQVREAIENIPGFRYMTERLPLLSGPGRRMIYEQPWIEDARRLEAEWERVEAVNRMLADPDQQEMFSLLRIKLGQLRDIRGLVKCLEERVVFDEVGFYELKHFMLLAVEIAGLWGNRGVVRFPALTGALDLLDPEHHRIPAFYVYDAYSPELAVLRKELKVRDEKDDTGPLQARITEIEDRVKVRLSDELAAHRAAIAETLKETGRLDMLIAKAVLAQEENLCRPVVASDFSGGTVYEGLVYPPLRAVLAQEGRTYQPVDLRLIPGATLITGANMAGKSILLKSVALAQALAQLGFYVPARQAVLTPVEKIFILSGDEQDELAGLSSFGAEMLRLNGLVGPVAQGRRLLILIDELARTTNPEEGRAIVSGVLDFLRVPNALVLITTHYSGILTACRKLRIRGFTEKTDALPSLKTINEYMDYSLLPDDGTQVPREAVRIAEILGVEPVLIGKIKEYLSEDRDRASGIK